MLHENLSEVTLSHDVVEKFYPLLADLIVEARSRMLVPHSVD